ncbi:hypothetical protein WJ95_28440 [Burkholderia ubonensis]|uniref:catalase-related domain-containing protein n=1 Tax=Burkholderia ubonensis TaxID=101571 RepID=UPI00075CCA81|nr:catalase-related domain-containing protein [Burkholderia ubonensis]KVQ00499.1 hypothetical protein WJ95_28440 [Burkholderia ubonensis]
MSLTREQRGNLVSNLAADLGQVKDDQVKYTMLSNFQKADPEYGRNLALAVKADPSHVETLAAKIAN